MGNRLSFGAEGTHKAEILQSPSTKDETKAAGGYSDAQHVRQEVIWQQPTTRTTEATSYSLFDPHHDRKFETLQRHLGLLRTKTQRTVRSQMPYRVAQMTYEQKLNDE